MNPSDIAAWWGAIVASAVLIWDMYKWRNDGPKLAMRVSSNMLVVGDPERKDKKWVSVTISNIGSRPTTLNGIGMEHYKSWMARLRNKTSIAAVFPNPSTNFPLPRVLNPGDEWLGLIPQERIDKEIALDELARKGHLMIWAMQSHTTRAKRVRLRIKGK